MIRFFTAGESHGSMLNTILDGIPAGLMLTKEAIEYELIRRKKGFGVSQRMAIEDDQVMITSGLIQGKTTGAPIAISIKNKDCFFNKKTPIKIPRPGHADLTGAIKYGYKDLRLSSERSSARETAMRVCVGAICKKLLLSFGIEIAGYVVQIGRIKKKVTSLCFEKIKEKAEKSIIRCPFPKVEKKMLYEIKKASEEEDTLGGILEVIAWNVPAGLGSYIQYDQRLDAQIAFLIMSIPGIKGVEFAHAFENAAKRGSAVHDEIFLSNQGELQRKSNQAGGLEGGITNGQPIVVRAAMKPISSVKKGMKSVDIQTRKPQLTRYERSDVCAVPRAVVVGESMLAFALANALTDKLGGDTIEEMTERFFSLRKSL